MRPLEQADAVRQPPSRFTPRRRGHAVTRRSWIATLALALALAPGCDLLQGDDDDSGGGQIASAPYTTTDSVNTGSATLQATFLTESISEASRSIGIVFYSTTGDEQYKVVDHGFFLSSDGEPVYITGPDGKKAPLSFPVINDADYGFQLANNEASTVFFPNDGNSATLKAGEWSFPVANFDANLESLVTDTVGAMIFHKTETGQTPTLKLNVFVLNGVSGGITNQTQAESDPEIQGAVAVLRNVYENNDAIGVNVEITVEYVDDPSRAAVLSTPGVIETEAQQFDLLSGYPETPAHDAMNIFVISSLDYIEPDAGGGVVGLAAGIPGSFNLQGLATSGTLAEYQGDGDGTILGFTLAHEFGHFLGLFHTSQTNGSQTSIIGEDPVSDTKLCKTSQVILGIDECPDRSNLMFPIVDEEDNPEVSTGQGNVVKYNPGVTVP